MSLAEQAESLLTEQVTKAYGPLKQYSGLIDKPRMPTKLSDYEPLIRQYESLIPKLSQISTSLNFDIFQPLIESYKKKEMGDWVERGERLGDELEKKISEVKAQIDSEVEKTNQGFRDEYEKGNKVYLDLEERRKEIEAYKDVIIDLCAQNGVTSSDIALSNDSYKLEEWNAIYDSAIEFITKSSGFFNPISKVRDLYDRDVKADTALFVITCGLCLTTIVNFVAIFAFVLVCYSEFTVKKKLEQYAVLLGLLYNVRPLEMGYQPDFDESQLLDADKAEDEDERTEEILAWYDAEMEKYEAEDPTSKIDVELAEFNKTIIELTKKYKGVEEVLVQSKNELLGKLQELINRLKAEFEEEKSKVKKLGEVQSTSYVYNNKYMLGMEQGCMPEYIDCGLQNIVIRPSSNHALMTQFIQVMLINACCNVRPTALNITVVDPNGRGKDVISFRTEENSEFFHIETKDMKTIIDTYSDIVRKNLNTLRGIDIQSYNKASEESGRTTINYQLIIILSGAEKREDNEALGEFMQYSAQAGVFVWVITPINYPHCYVFDKPFVGVKEKYNITMEDLREFGDVYTERLSKTKPKGIGWKDYLDRAVKDPEDFWALKGDEFVWFEPGFVDGDPSRPDHYTLGNTGDVHAIIAGTSGSGKSVFINHLIATCTYRYSPNDLRLWLVDFKGSEFSFYLKTKENPETLPHIDACLCTSDPEYSKSLFTALRQEADRRYNILKGLQLKNMVQYNELMEKQGTPEKKWARTVMICDEFQVIFTKADAKTIDSVTQDITLISKVARACGVHLIFASQSMKGTISGDILNMFTLRFCLRCEVEVSQSILGTPYAGYIRQKNGLLYVSSIDDKSKEAQKLFKTPWAPDEMLRAHIKRCYNEAEKIGFKYGNVIEYNELTKHDISEVLPVFEAVRKKNTVPTTGVIMLGRLMVYSQNQAPENIIFTPENNQNIFSAFNDNADFINFFYTLQTSMGQWDTKPVVIYNSQSSDYHYLCHLDESITDKRLQELSTPSTSIETMIGYFEKMVEARKKSSNNDVPLVFVCIGWDNAVGFGIEPKDKWTSKVTLLMQTAGPLNVHWVFIGNSKTNVPTSLINACKYRICGKVDERTAMTLCDSGIPAKTIELPNGYAFLYTNNKMSKFKIYQSVLDRKPKETKVVL